MPGRLTIQPNGVTWEKSPSALEELFARLVPKDSDVRVKPMFGWPCCFVNGNLSAGLHQDSMLFRLPEAELQQFLNLEGAAEFEPMPGRKLKGYGLLADPLSRDPGLLTKWLCRSLTYVRTLPKKKKPAPQGAKKRA